MPVAIHCPDCGRKLKVPDDVLGKKIRCPACKSPFIASAEEEEAIESPRQKVSAGRVRREPAPARAEAGRRRSAVNEDSSDEEEVPRPKKRKAKKREASSPRLALWLGLGGAGVLAVVLTAGIVLWLDNRKAPPADATTQGPPASVKRPTAPSMTPEEANQKADHLVALATDKKVNQRDYQKAAQEIANQLSAANQAEVPAVRLAELLTVRYTPHRKRVAMTFGLLGPQAAKVIPQLLEALKDGDIRVELVRSLGTMCREEPRQPASTPQVVEALTRYLTKEVPPDTKEQRQFAQAPVQCYVLQSLASMGKPAQAAIPQIVEMLDVNFGPVRGNAAATLGRIGGPVPAGAIATLQRLSTSDPDPEVRQHASSALQKLSAK